MTSTEKLGRFMLGKMNKKSTLLGEIAENIGYIRNTFKQFLLSCVALISVFSYGPHESITVSCE